ncbi:MAG: alpha/beta hydrolase [Kibdelosporangium sp.]
MPTFKSTAQAAAIQAVFALPHRLRRVIAGPPVRIDGQELALDAQLLLRMQRLARLPALSEGTPAEARSHLDGDTVLVSGPPIEPVGTREVRIGSIGARLYTPAGLAEGSPLLVFYHGGGFVLGSIESHDNTCRFLAKHAGVRVLSVDYRLAPEHPFPAGVLDAVAAFEYAHANAHALGADPTAIAVGGDSAGGNLAAVTAYLTVQAGGPKPAFQLLFYPATDATVRTRSQELFAERFLLTQADMDWFMGHYATSEEDKRDPRYSPMLAADLSGLPPAYLATAGFDPLRDEGEAYAERLRAAGVPVVLSRQADLIHGYANFLAVGTRFREALFEAVGALRTGLGITTVHANE